MTTETTTNPVEGADAPEAEVDTTSDDIDLSIQLDEADTGQSPEPEDEEVEYEGAKYRVPKPLKDAILRQADYTRKTQEVAKSRGEIEAERKAVAEERAALQQQAQLSQENLDTLAEIKSLQLQAAEYEKIDWDAYDDQAPEESAKAWRRYQRLMQSIGQKSQGFTQKIEERKQQHERETAERRSSAAAEIAKAIPNWSPETKSKLAETALELGFAAQDLENESDPRAWKLLHLADIGRRYEKQRALAAQKAKGQQTAPAHALRGNNGQFSPAADTSDFAAFEKLADAALKKRA